MGFYSERKAGADKGNAGVNSFYFSQLSPKISFKTRYMV